MPDAITPSSWTDFAKFAGMFDFRMGTRETAVGRYFHAIHVRIGSIWGEPIEHATRFEYLYDVTDAIKFASKSPILHEKDHPATSSVRAFRSWIRKHPPRCLGGLIAEWVDKPIKPLNDVAAAFDVRHSRGNEARVYRHLVEEYTISPVHLAWRPDSRSAPTEPTLFIDSDIHGYHSEAEPQGVHTHPRRQGIGQPVACSKCGNEWFKLRIVFDYSGFDEHADSPHDFPVQNFFDAFSIDATCSKCGRKQRVFTMGEL